MFATVQRLAENMDDAQRRLNIFKLKTLSDLKIFILLRAFGNQTIASLIHLIYTRRRL